MYEYNAKVIRIIDGDTYELEVDLGFGITITRKFRLLGIDTPETYRPKSPKELIHGNEATSFVKAVLTDKCKIQVFQQGYYKRWLIGLKYTTANGEEKNLVHELMKRGFAKRPVY